MFWSMCCPHVAACLCHTDPHLLQPSLATQAHKILKWTNELSYWQSRTCEKAVAAVTAKRMALICGRNCENASKVTFLSSELAEVKNTLL